MTIEELKDFIDKYPNRYDVTGLVTIVPKDYFSLKANMTFYRLNIKTFKLDHHAQMLTIVLDEIVRDES